MLTYDCEGGIEFRHFQPDSPRDMQPMLKALYDTQIVMRKFQARVNTKMTHFHRKFRFHEQAAYLPKISLDKIKTCGIGISWPSF